MFFYGFIQIFEEDVEIISVWLTFDHICRMCDDQVVPCPNEAVNDVMSPPSDPDKMSLIYEIPFPFNVIKLLTHSRQVNFLFSTLIEHERGKNISYFLIVHLFNKFTTCSY